jgi:PAS domain S-box-containing protein
MKIKYYLVLTFIALNALVYYVTDKNTQSKIEYSKFHHMNKLQINYEIFMTTQADKADVIYETTIKTKGLTDILSLAWETKDPEERSLLREKMLSLLEKRYEKFKEQGLLQYHFVFPDNTVFLRVHKVNKFGDDLSSVRYDFDKVNKTKQIVRGFSQGRTSHAFRNVYPLFDKNNNHIGAIEISYPSELLQQKLNKISKIESHFLVNKHIFDSTMWSRDDRILTYVSSLEHEDYLLTLSKTFEKEGHMEKTSQKLQGLQGQINEGMKKHKKFSLVTSDIISDIEVISFYPVRQNITNDVSAWIVAYDKAPFIYPAIKDSYYIRGISFFIFAALLYFMYKTEKQKNTLSKLLSSYDQNVIFSTSDLEGNITHVSKAFCKISGYSEDELMGKPHNILRHKQMQPKLFKNMWETVQSQKTWKGEVKNRRKDGSYYWVEAEIEPLYDDENKHIGYSAVRHDITDKKEIEEIQKEIIFTMGSIGESRSKETGNHVKRVAEYSKILALKYGLSEDEAELLKQASPMHDIGKVGIPDSILKKPGPLEKKEWEIMKTHSQIGYNMLNSSKRPLLKTAAIVAHQHHEKWDGNGYPNGLKEEQIHIYGRITAVADVFDALSSDRVYKSAWDDEKIFQLFKEESGKHFDPKLIEIFFEHKNDFIKIRKKFKDI